MVEGSVILERTFKLKHKIGFSAIFDILLEYLREWVIINARDEFQIRWPDDLRLQPFRDRHSWNSDRKALVEGEEFRHAIRLVLHKLVSLNKFIRSCATRVLGHSIVVFHTPVPHYGYPLPKGYSGGFGHMGDYTRAVDFRDWSGSYSSGDTIPFRSQFLQALTRTAGSICLLQFAFFDHRDSATTLLKLLECAPLLEELCLLARSRASIGIINDLFGAERNIPECASLRIIRLELFSFERPHELDRGLPCELSSLHRFKSLTAVHVYNPTPERPDTLHSVEKINWTRAAGETEFVLESVWFCATQFYFVAPPKMSRHMPCLLKKAINVTLQGPFEFVIEAARVFLPIWTSLHSLTILTDEVQSVIPLSFIRTAITSLTIRFKAHTTAIQPSLLDEELLGFLRRHTTKDIRLCIEKMPDGELGAMPTKTSGDAVPLHRNSFPKAGALCKERAGQFIVDVL